jgi:hypothetical protein
MSHDARGGARRFLLRVTLSSTALFPKHMKPTRRMLPFAPIALAAALAACKSDLLSPEFENPAAGKAVLFIGNSLTYYNDLPVMVQGLADAAGGDSLIIGMVAGPDMALVDHWKKGDAQKMIASRRWDFVVLQQGPSSTSINRDSLRTLVAMFAPLIADAGGKAVLFSAWPAIDRRQDFARAAESYRLAAEDVGGLYAPVANAWVEAWDRDAGLQLYADGLHGNTAGSYLAALVIYARILGKSPVGLPSRIPMRNGNALTVPAAVNALLQEAAWAAVQPTIAAGRRSASHQALTTSH